jgi:hypothetical protein
MDAESINEKLLLYYGKELDGRQRYRVVWTSHQFEKRAGEFNEFCGQIFLRTVIGIKEVPKYPWDPDKWAIEKLFYLKNDEILSEKPGSYEPLYILKDKEGNFLPLNWRVVDMVVKFADNRPTGIKLTDADWSQMEQQEIDADTGYFEDELEDKGRSNLFAFENSVFLDSTRRL